MNTNEMRRQRAALIEQARAIHDAAGSEGMTGEQQEQFTRRMDEADNLWRQIEQAERLERAEAGLEQSIHRGGNASQGAGDHDQRAYHEAFTQWARGGMQECTPEQRTLLAQHRAQSAVTGNAGGFVVPQGFFGRVVEAMKDFNGVRGVATILPTQSGNDIPVPTVNDTANEGELLGENTPANPQDLAFNRVILKAYKYSSKTVLVPFELLQDEAVNLEQLIGRMLGERLGRITNKHFTIGDNSDKPQGVVTASGEGKVGVTGQTTSVTVADLVDLLHSVDIAYRSGGRARWMMHDQTLKALKMLKDEQERPLWLPGLAVREPDTILGYPYVINNHMPVMAAGQKSILFGDFSTYMIRDVMEMQLFRISDKYIESGQVGFLAFYRGDGRQVDAGMSPIKHYKNAAN